MGTNDIPSKWVEMAKCVGAMIDDLEDCNEKVIVVVGPLDDDVCKERNALRLIAKDGSVVSSGPI